MDEGRSLASYIFADANFIRGGWLLLSVMMCITIWRSEGAIAQRAWDLLWPIWVFLGALNLLGRPFIVVLKLVRDRLFPPKRPELR